MIIMCSNQLDRQPDKHVHRYSHCASNPLQVTKMKTLGSQLYKELQGNNFSLPNTNCFVILSFVSASFSLSRYNFLFVCLGCCHLVQWKLWNTVTSKWHRTKAKKHSSVLQDVSVDVQVSRSGILKISWQELCNTQFWQLAPLWTFQSINESSIKSLNLLTILSDSFSESKSTSQEQNYGSKKTGNSNFLRFSKLMWIWEAHTPWKYLKCRRKYSEKLKNPLSFYLVCKHLSIEKNLWRSQTIFITFQNIFFGYHLSHQIGIFPMFCLALKWKNKRTFSPEHMQVRTNTVRTNTAVWFILWKHFQESLPKA